MTKEYGKTITTFLIEGNVDGAKYVSLEGIDMKCLVIPRNSLSLNTISSREDIQQTSMYFLLNRDNESEVQIYIGETDNLLNRIKQHKEKNEKIWDLAIGFISYGNNISKSDVLYLERKAYQALHNKDMGFKLTNTSQPGRKNMPEHREATMNQFFDDIKLIMGFLGYGFFKQSDNDMKISSINDTNLENGQENLNNNQIFYLTNKKIGIKAQMLCHKGQYILLSGSIINSEVINHKSLPESTFIYRQKNKYIKLHGRSEKIKESPNLVATTSNISFQTPSAAAVFAVGRAINGWSDWKNLEGKSLDDCIRSAMS